MVSTIVVLHVNMMLHGTHEMVEEIQNCDLKQVLKDQNFEEYLDSNSLTWQDDLDLQEIKLLEIQKNHYIFIEITHELLLETLDLVLQEWILQSAYSPYLYDILGNKSIYLDLVDAVIVKDCVVPDTFNHLLKVTILDEQERTFLTTDHRVVKLTPPIITIFGN